MDRILSAVGQLDKAIAFFQGGEPALAEGRLKVAVDVIGREICFACRGLGAQARADGARFDGAGPHFPCPDCGAKASDGWGGGR